MAYTDFPNGVTSFGVPMVGGIGGIPLTGNWYFCDYANGSDGNEGTADNPFKTISYAHTKAVAGNNDVVVIVGDGSTTATQRLTETLTWSKNATHLIGMTAPSLEAQRARISHETTEDTNFLMMTVSASGCIFANFSFFQGVGEASTDEKLIDVTGSRNCFSNVQFGGMGNSVGAGRAGSYVIYINGGGENLFSHCSVGLETVQRSAANASVVIASGAQRNTFEDCIFPIAASATSPLYLDASASNALNGSSMRFRRCSFYALLNISSAATPAVVASVASDVNGTVFFDGCSTSATKWAAAATTVQVGSAGTTNVADGFDAGKFDQARDS